MILLVVRRRRAGSSPCRRRTPALRRLRDHLPAVSAPPRPARRAPLSLRARYHPPVSSALRTTNVQLNSGSQWILWSCLPVAHKLHAIYISGVSYALKTIQNDNGQLNSEIQEIVWSRSAQKSGNSYQCMGH